MLDYLNNFDQIITKILSDIVPHNVFFDYFFSFFSLKGASILVWLLVIVMVVILEERKNPGISKRDKKFIILFSIVFLLAFFVSDIFLKNIFQRPRPSFLLPTPYPLQPFSCPADFSFPSAHAATAFAAATVLTFFDKKRHWFYYTVAILISYSRIYLGCHYFFDVVVGAFFGWFVSVIILKLFQSSPGTSPSRRKS